VKIDAHDDQRAYSRLRDTDYQESIVSRRQDFHGAVGVVADNNDIFGGGELEAAATESGELGTVATLTLGMNSDISVTNSRWWARVPRWDVVTCSRVVIWHVTNILDHHNDLFHPITRATAARTA
jgi:hypothetical protein